MTPPTDERARLAALALKLSAERGEVVSRSALAAAAGIPRARVEAIFTDEVELLDALIADWFGELTVVMEDVLASDLPPNRKLYEFFARRFVINRQRYRADPAGFTVLCDLGSTHFERVRSYVDLADHYLCELIAQAQADGAFPGLAIDDALSLINQMTMPYNYADHLTFLDAKLSEEKLGRIVDTMFAGLSGADGGAKGTRDLRLGVVA